MCSSWRCSSSSNLFDSNEDFVGEIVSERFFVLRHKFCKGDYGEEKQVVEDQVKKVDKFILLEIQVKGEICWVLFAMIS